MKRHKGCGALLVQSTKREKTGFHKLFFIERQTTSNPSSQLTQCICPFRLSFSSCFSLVVNSDEKRKTFIHLND
jgi:hypothetical protein